MMDKAEYERRKDSIKRQTRDWAQVRGVAEANVKELQTELSDLQDAYIGSLKDQT